MKKLKLMGKAMLTKDEMKKVSGGYTDPCYVPCDPCWSTALSGWSCSVPHWLNCAGDTAFVCDLGNPDYWGTYYTDCQYIGNGC